MPEPGSHKYDIKRTRLRDEYDEHGVPSKQADPDRAANERLQRDNPPVKVGDPDRAAGPKGTRGMSRGDPAIDDPAQPLASGLELRSSAFTDHTLIPYRYSRQGDNLSPPLEWGYIPDGTEELALVCQDQDALGGTFTHWVVTNLFPYNGGIGEDSLPEGASAGRNSTGELGWTGPQPPVGADEHHYFFRLYAVDRPLGLDEGASADDVHAAVDGHCLATGTLVGLFGR